VTDAPDGSVQPARPKTRLTDDGRRMREVLSYARRSARLSDGQQQAWERQRERWWLSPDAVQAAGFTWAAAFGREAPLMVEIGSGVGEATVAVAEKHPDHNVLALEVWLPGVAQTMLRMERAGVDNVRLCGLDAVWAMDHLFAEESIDELLTFFPDPWPKKKHHKRRLLQTAFVAGAAGRLRRGGTWRLATDWPDYAAQIAEVLGAEPLLDGGQVERWETRPVTRFERRGVEAGRPIADFAYRRR
jgi:tRNA (guanine-N7-)-methyltransferase